MSAPAAVKFASYWRRAGMNYLEMLNTSSGALVQVLKEPMRSKALAKGSAQYRDTLYQDGMELEPGECCGPVRGRG